MCWVHSASQLTLISHLTPHDQTDLFDEPSEESSLHGLGVGCEGLGTGHQAKREPMAAEEVEDVVLLPVRTASDVDDEVA